MQELIAKSLPFVGPLLLPALILLLTPMCGRRVRMVFASLLALAAVGFVVDVLLFDHTQERTLAVPNVFPRGAAATPFVWTTATVAAPSWHWHLWLAGSMLVLALLLFVRRDREAHVPPPVVYGTGVFLFYLLLRLGLEWTAAPMEIVWATGGTIVLLLITPFFGWYCGRHGFPFGRFARSLLLMAFAQRVPLVAIGWFATTRHLGTHLDTHVVEDMNLIGFGDIKLETDWARWFYATCLPHLTLWIVATVVLGLVLGSLPFWLAKRGGHRA